MPPFWVKSNASITLIIVHTQLPFLKMGKVRLTPSILMAFILLARAENPTRIACPEEDLKFGDIISSIEGVASCEDCAWYVACKPSARVLGFNVDVPSFRKDLQPVLSLQLLVLEQGRD